MTSGQSTHESGMDNWPTFDLTYTFNPDAIGSRTRIRFDPDEVVLYDPAGEAGEAGRWLSAKRNAYLPLEEIR